MKLRLILSLGLILGKEQGLPLRLNGRRSYSGVLGSQVRSGGSGILRGVVGGSRRIEREREVCFPSWSDRYFYFYYLPY